MSATPIENATEQKILRATLPTDGATAWLIALGPNIYPTVVNDRWRIEPMDKATFISYRWIWPFNKRLRWTKVP